MATFTGDAAANIIDGTNQADVIMALGGNDTVNALGGDDIIFGGLGVDRMFGGEGNDTFVEDQIVSFVPASSAGAPALSELFDGGDGTDTIELRAVPAQFQVVSSFATFSPHNLNLASLVSIERLVFASGAGETVSATLTLAQAAGFTQIVGGAGRNFISLVTPGPGTYTIPTLALTNWDAAPVNAWNATTSDFVVLSAVNVANSANTLIASSTLNALQVLQGSAGNDTLIGSPRADSLNGSAGVNMLFGGGGNDALTITNIFVPTLINGQFVYTQPTFLTGAGSLFDGGEGTDVLSIGGAVSFQGTLAGIEGVNLLPAFIPLLPNVAKQETAVLTMDLAHFAMLPTTALFRGTGLVAVDFKQGESFDFSGYVIEPGSNIVFAFDGDSDGFTPGVPVTWIGSDTSDIFEVSADMATVTGGGGADIFGLGDSVSVITDFTRGEDKIAADEIFGLTTLQRFNDFLRQDGADTIFEISNFGDYARVTFQNVTLADLTNDDFVFAEASPFGYSFSAFATDDMLFGYQLNDQFFGGEGNDRLYGGGGVDRLFGEGGNDTLILDGQVGFNIPGGLVAAYDGGSGFDTLELRPAGINFASPNGQFTSYALVNAQIAGIERMVFASTAQNGILVSLFAIAVPGSGITQLVGGAGADTFVTLASTAFGTSSFTMPSFTLSNWTSLAEPYRQAGGDTLVLNVFGPGNFTLNARDGSGATQALLGGAGDDTLNGSDGIDFLNGNGGANVLRGNGGNDALVIANTLVQTGQFSFATTTFTGAGSTFDGGAGFDVLSVGGAVNFAGTLSGIEGIYLQSAFSSTTPGGTGSQAAAYLTLAAAQLAALPGNLQLDGTGTVTVRLAAGDGYDGSGFTVRSGAQVTVDVAGSTADDTLRLGAAHELVDGGDGIDTAVLAGASSAYSVAAGANGAVLIGDDSLRNVELFRFLDGLFTFDGTRLVPKPNTAPTAIDDHAAVNEDATVTGNVIAGSDSDPDPGQVLNVIAIDGAALTGAPIKGLYGTLTIAADGSYSYAADADVVDAFAPGTVLVESFAYTVGDGNGGIASATLTFDITTIADNPALAGGNGNNRLSGTGMDEFLFGGRGDDTLSGGGGADRLNGQQGADRLAGGDGFDLLIGGQGADWLFGDAGNDLLVGGKGADLMFGGSGADVFEFGDLAPTTDRDVIGDFELGVDAIHLSNGLAITGSSMSNGSTVLSLSNGGSILLQGVDTTGFVGSLTGELPGWSTGLPLG